MKLEPVSIFAGKNRVETMAANSVKRGALFLCVCGKSHVEVVRASEELHSARRDQGTGVFDRWRRGWKVGCCPVSLRL